MAVAEKIIPEAVLRANLAANLKRLLDQREISQNALAKAVGVTADTIGAIFHQRHTPNVAIVAAVAVVLGSTVDAMIGFPKPGRKPRKAA